MAHSDTAFEGNFFERNCYLVVDTFILKKINKSKP